MVVVEDTVAEGDLVVARCTVRGKHVGDHLGVAPSNAQVEFTGIGMGRVKDGKFVETWNNFDFLTMNQQMAIK
jgi:predicted ester cyclase